MIYIYFMKTKLIRFFALASLVFFFNGCTPDEVETTQDQFKPLKLKVTLANPIHASNETDDTNPLFQSYNGLEVSWNYGGQSLLGEYPNQVGQNQIELNTTAVSNTPIIISLNYGDYVVNGLTTNFTCNTVTTEVTYNNVVIYSQTRELGSEDGTCGDGFEWGINITLP